MGKKKVTSKKEESPLGPVIIRKVSSDSGNAERSSGKTAASSSLTQKSEKNGASRSPAKKK